MYSSFMLFSVPILFLILYVSKKLYAYTIRAGIINIGSEVIIATDIHATNKIQIEDIIATQYHKIETLRQITGGVPRTFVMLFDIFIDDEGDAFECSNK